MGIKNQLQVKELIEKAALGGYLAAFLAAGFFAAGFLAAVVFVAAGLAVAFFTGVAFAAGFLVVAMVILIHENGGRLRLVSAQLIML